jgi:hypothetical protein
MLVDLDIPVLLFASGVALVLVVVSLDEDFAAMLPNACSCAGAGVVGAENWCHLQTHLQHRGQVPGGHSPSTTRGSRLFSKLESFGPEVV